MFICFSCIFINQIGPHLLALNFKCQRRINILIGLSKILLIFFFNFSYLILLLKIRSLDLKFIVIFFNGKIYYIYRQTKGIRSQVLHQKEK